MMDWNEGKRRGGGCEREGCEEEEVREKMADEECRGDGWRWIWRGYRLTSWTGLMLLLLSGMRRMGRLLLRV